MSQHTPSIDVSSSLPSPRSDLAAGALIDLHGHHALEAAGRWGVRTMVFEGDPCFSQDRQDLPLWRSKSAGLAARV